MGRDHLLAAGKLHILQPVMARRPSLRTAVRLPRAQTVPSEGASSLRQLRMGSRQLPWRVPAAGRSCSRSLGRPNANSSRVMAALVSVHMKHQPRFMAEASRCVVMSSRGEAVGGTWELDAEQQQQLPES